MCFPLDSLPELSLYCPLTVERKDNNSGESRSLLASVEVKDSTVVAGNKQENAPDTDTSSELIKDLTGYFWELYAPEINGVRRRPLLFTDRFLSSRWWNILWRFQIAVTLSEVLTSKTTFISAGALQRIYWVLIRLSTRSLGSKYRTPINKSEGLQTNDYDIIVQYESTSIIFIYS